MAIEFQEKAESNREEYAQRKASWDEIMRKTFKEALIEHKIIDQETSDWEGKKLSLDQAYECQKKLCIEFKIELQEKIEW